MRKMGAMARTILEQAAAKKWNIPVSNCKAENHFVKNSTTGEEIFFGDLVEEAKSIAIPSDENIILKDKKEFKYIGKKVIRGIDMEDFLQNYLQL